MQELNLPEYSFRTKIEGGKKMIFDANRKKFVVLTPEEWVRQNFIQYLIQEKKYPANLMAVEKQILVNGKQRRFDLLVYQKNGQPLLIAEFKAPKVSVSQDAFDQVVRYNMVLRVEHVVVSNGLNHFACQVDYANKSYAFLKNIPEYCEPCRGRAEGQGFC